MVRTGNTYYKFKTKAFVNKNNKQVSIIIPKKKLKKMNSDLKFNEDLFVELKIFNKKKDGN